MADTEAEAAAPEGAVENQPENVEEGEAKTEQVEADNENQGETQPEEKPASPEAKDDAENVGEPPVEASEEKPAAEESEETPKPEGEESKQEEGGEAEKPAESEEKPEGEEAQDSAEANAESSEAAETTEGQPDGVDGAAAEAGDSEAAAGEAAEGETVEETAPVEGEEGAEAAEPQTGEETEGETKEGEPEAEAVAEDGEKKTDEDAEKTEEEDGKVEEPVADEGDREASPVGEKLSREPTPDAIKAVEMEHERLEATTPDKIDEEGEGEYELREEDEEQMEEEEEEDEEDDDVEPAFKREELIERYHEALADREQLQQHNYALQHKLAEYFRKKKADERQDYDKNVTDQEQRYLKYMAQLEDLRRQDMMEKDNFRAQIEDAKERCQDKKEKVDFERKKFMEFKKQVALNSVNSRSGKPIPPKDIEQYLVNEVKKEQEVVNVRLENIKLKNKLKKKDQQLKSKEELAEGLHLIDFEQLKIENQTYNEKIEERNEELLKLRKKITSTVQVLTHLKEKLQFVQGENLEQSDTLKIVESSLAQSRDVLSRTKQARDALRIDNQRLRQNCGLLGNEPLLRDFEERKDEGDDLRSKLEELRMRHAELTLHCNQVRRKIEQARQTMT